eukprot:15469224-Alexandrium_andersonii.AAC.1
MHHHPFLLGCDWATAGFLHEVQDPFPVFLVSCVLPLLVHGEVGLVEEVRVAELAHQRAAKRRLVAPNA